ncbi:hypothetical protein [Nibricoccus sp. IMCC34717]|uniref:hypothetical protein n=1 Tax=Nibricoccus sp. IMCC34717 TaxID=3034021 RepID=UPI00384C8FC2
MKRVIQVDGWLLVPQSTGWRAVTCAGVPGLLSALAHAFPKRTSLQLLIDHEGLEARTITAGICSREVLRAAAEEQAPEQARSGSAWFLEPTIHSAGEEFATTLWTERQPLVPLLAELLPVRNNQRLESAFPLAFALANPSAKPGRADLTCLILPDRLVVLGRDANGQPCRLKLPRCLNEAHDAEMRDAMSRLGAATDSRVGMPAVLRVVQFEGILEGEDERALRRNFAALNHYETLSLRGRKAASELRFSGPTQSLVPRSAGVAWGNLLRGLQMAAAALALGAAVHGYVTTQALRVQAAASKRQATEVAEAVKKAERASDELARLDRLYGKDAGWGAALPRDFVASLDTLVPNEFSLDLVEWEPEGRLRFEAVHWGEAAKREGAAGESLCKGVIKASPLLQGRGSLTLDERLGKLHFEPGRATGS